MNKHNLKKITVTMLLAFSGIVIASPEMSASSHNSEGNCRDVLSVINKLAEDTSSANSCGSIDNDESFRACLKENPQVVGLLSPPNASRKYESGCDCGIRGNQEIDWLAKNRIELRKILADSDILTNTPGTGDAATDKKANDAHQAKVGKVPTSATGGTVGEMSNNSGLNMNCTAAVMDATKKITGNLPELNPAEFDPFGNNGGGGTGGGGLLGTLTKSISGALSSITASLPTSLKGVLGDLGSVISSSGLIDLNPTTLVTGAMNGLVKTGCAQLKGLSGEVVGSVQGSTIYKATANVYSNPTVQGIATPGINAVVRPTVNGLPTNTVRGNQLLNLVR